MSFSLGFHPWRVCDLTTLMKTLLLSVSCDHKSCKCDLIWEKASRSVNVKLLGGACIHSVLELFLLICIDLIEFIWIRILNSFPMVLCQILKLHLSNFWSLIILFINSFLFYFYKKLELDYLFQFAVPWAPGGSKFCRNPTPPAGVICYNSLFSSVCKC